MIYYLYIEHLRVNNLYFMSPIYKDLNINTQKLCKIEFKLEKNYISFCIEFKRVYCKFEKLQQHCKNCKKGMFTNSLKHK